GLIVRGLAQRFDDQVPAALPFQGIFRFGHQRPSRALPVMLGQDPHDMDFAGMAVMDCDANETDARPVGRPSPPERQGSGIPYACSAFSMPNHSGRRRKMSSAIRDF